MRPTAGRSSEPVTLQDDIEGSLGTTPRIPGGYAAARNVPVARARALLIYLKHRGVLNVEEFRRANSRGR